ncbi:TetR family transcriptional regulator [Kribbella sp. CA-245084]|uniref:TetR/AcrR family transcriptional regulator n=1 Tax=Kribbella sp. CA-245084 TaxID=3239940 RepID=UPI003D8A7843
MAERRAGRAPGRRPGRPATRDEILGAARGLFAERGYVRTTIRAVGAVAGVDPALVHHYFGTKERLFRAALEVPVDPDVLVDEIVSAGFDEAPSRLVEAFLQVWDAPETGPAVVSFVRRVLSEPESADLVREFFAANVLGGAARKLLGDVAPDEAGVRIGLVMSQMFGLVILRKVLGVEPIATMPADQLAVMVTPTIIRYLRGGLSDVLLPTATESQEVGLS